jgi:2-polyprenyl-6-methoxyphenol hydroxylase-like FAD-dependent oxidoreductase
MARFEGIRFIDAAGTVEARFPQGCGFGVRRTVLHQRLLDRAAGIAMNWGVRISHVSGSDITINGQKVRARWLVCADGQNSQLRNLAGLNQSSMEPIVLPIIGLSATRFASDGNNGMEAYSPIGRVKCRPFTPTLFRSRSNISGLSNRSRHCSFRAAEICSWR